MKIQLTKARAVKELDRILHIVKTIRMRIMMMSGYSDLKRKFHKLKMF